MPRHPLDPLALVSGLAFCALGIAGLGTWVDVRHADSDWLTPVVLVLLGLMLVASIVSRSLPRSAAEPGRPLAGEPGRSAAAEPGRSDREPADDPFGNLRGAPGVGDTSGSRDP
jgi:hypothetical protein